MHGGPGKPRPTSGAIFTEEEARLLPANQADFRDITCLASGTSDLKRLK